MGKLCEREKESCFPPLSNCAHLQLRSRINILRDFNLLCLSRSAPVDRPTKNGHMRHSFSIITYCNAIDPGNLFAYAFIHWINS